MNSNSNINGYWSLDQSTYSVKLKTCFAEYRVTNIKDNWVRYYIYNINKQVQINALVVDNSGQGGTYKTFEDAYYKDQMQIFGENDFKPNLVK